MFADDWKSLPQVAASDSLIRNGRDRGFPGSDDEIVESQKLRAATTTRAGPTQIECMLRLAPGQTTHSRPRTQAEAPIARLVAVELAGSRSQEGDQVGGVMKRVGDHAAV
jgi:hypothetical protein